MTTDSQTNIPDGAACRMSPRLKSLTAETPRNRGVNGNDHDTTTVPPSTATREAFAPAFRSNGRGPRRGPLVRATSRAAVAGLLAATAAIGTAQAQTRAPLDIRTGVYRGQPVTYEVIGGLAIVQGDIILGTPEELEPRDRQPAGNAVAAGNPARLSDRAKLPAPVTTRDAAANTDLDTRWPDGVVPYVIDEDLYLPTRVDDAIEHWEEHTSIRFVERTDESNWVNFMKPEVSTCASRLGMVGGEQDISLADGCSVAATIHEIGHAVGLWHEQEREDRDNHVMVLSENIDKRRLFNFMQDIVRQDDIGPYDYGSIMHYSAYDFSRNDQPTIETIPPGLPIGQRVGLSAGDIDGVARLYGPMPGMTTISTNPEGLDVEVDGMMFTTPQSFDWALGTSHTIGVPSTQGDDTERFSFAKWSDGGDREHTVAASSVTTVFTAHFIQEFQVESGARPPAGGTVTIAPPSADGFYVARTPIEVTAVPAEGYAFGQWLGDLRDEHHGLSGNPARLPSVPDDLNYTAIFTQSPLTTIDTNAPGRRAEVDGDLVRLPYNYNWPSGSTHTIGIEDEPQTSRSGANRWVFSQWNDGGAATHEITVPEEPSTFKADFKQQFLLTTQSRESRGSVEVTPASDDGFYDSGSSVQLTAVPRVGFQFIAWIDENGERISHDNPMTLTMNDQGWAAAFFSELPLESTTEMPTTNLISGAPPTEFSLPPVREATHFTGGPAFTVEVSEGSASLTVKLETRNPGVDIDLYVRHGAKPELSDTMIVSDYSATLPTGDETIVITTQSKTPLQSGTYFITFVLFETFVPARSAISAVVATAPADQAAFDALVVGQRMLSSVPASLYHVDFVEAGRFEEYRLGAGTDEGSYTYSNTGPDTGTVVFTYDAGKICTYLVNFASLTSGSLSYTCTEGDPGETDWRLVEDPDFVTVTPPDNGTVKPKSFAIPNLGGWSTTSNGTESAMRSGYGRIRAEAGSTTPSGIAIFGFRPGGVLIAEAGVPASEPVQEGRIFAEVREPVNTGLAMANPNDVPATILFYFRDAEGERFGDGQFELGAHEQTAKFLNQEPFNSGEVSGTFTFTSSQPIAVVALRGLTNRDGEFLMTTLPVAPLASTSTDTVYFPHFTDDDGWVTQVILVNPTDRPITGTIQFVGQGSATADAAPAILTLDDGRTGSEFPYSIPAGGSQRFTTSNPTGATTTGSVRATPDAGSFAPSGLVVFSFTPGGKTVSEVGVNALTAGSAFRVYAESSGTPNQPGSIRTGLAITNAADTDNTVTLAVTGLDGSMATGVAPVMLTLPPSGQVARFLDEIFDSLPANFSGVLQVTSTADVAIVGLRLRINERSELKMTTTPPSIETDTPNMMDRFFPHIVDSAGWSTQFILFSGTAGQASSGTLSFFDTAGEPWDLPTTSSISDGSASPD